jgi:hypothetical protein
LDDVTGSLSNVAAGALGPVIGGPSITFTNAKGEVLGQLGFDVAGLLNSAYNPRSGWMIAGHEPGRAVGAFEYAFGAVANSLASFGYSRIRRQAEKPSLARAARGRGASGSWVVIAGDGSDEEALRTNGDSGSRPWDVEWDDDDPIGAKEEYRQWVRGLRTWWAKRQEWERAEHIRNPFLSMADIIASREEAFPDYMAIINSSDIDLALKAGDKEWLNQLGYEEEPAPPPMSEERYRRLRDGYYVYSGLTVRFVPPTTDVWNPAYEDSIRIGDALGLRSSPDTRFSGKYEGANQYEAESYYHGLSAPQVKAAVESRHNQATLANMEANSQAGAGGILSGLTGFFSAWLGGNDPLKGYARGVEVGGAFDAMLGTRVEALNVRGMTAAQPSRPDVALVLSERPPEGILGGPPGSAGPVWPEAITVVQLSDGVIAFKGGPPPARAAQLALPGGAPPLLLGPGEPVVESPGGYVVGLGPEGLGGTVRLNRPPEVNVLPSFGPATGAPPASSLSLGPQGQGGVMLMNRGLRPGEMLPEVVIRYTGAMDVASDAQFNRFGLEWAQSRHGHLIRGERLSVDDALRARARAHMDRIGFDRTGLSAMHPLDSVANPFLSSGAEPGTTYYFGSASVNSSFGSQLGRQLNELGVRVGDPFRVRFEGFPSLDVVPPTAPPSSPPNLRDR